MVNTSNLYAYLSQWNILVFQIEGIIIIICLYAFFKDIYMANIGNLYAYSRDTLVYVDGGDYFCFFHNVTSE